MQLSDPRATGVGFLILRHLYDGDVIEWPISETDPNAQVFAQLEAQGFVARWDRIWPLSDRYRLTEKGIATIEAVYRPAGAEAFWEELRRQNLPPQGRRAFLQSRGLDPQLWPLLHDPSTHWSTHGVEVARWLSYVWEDQRPQKRKRQTKKQRTASAAGGGGRRVVHHHHDHYLYQQPVPILVDLDRQAHDTSGVAPAGPDVDAS